MALLSILTGNKPIRTKLTSDATGDVLLVDVTTSAEPEHDSDLSDHPVEDDYSITDNMKLKPITLQIQGTISESPINLAAEAQGLTSAASSALGSKVGGFGTAAGAIGGGFLGGALFKTSGRPDLDAYNILITLQKAKRLVTIVTALTEYKNMVLQKITFPKDQSTGRQLKFSATFREVIIVQSQTIQIANASPDVKAGATASSDLGTQASKVSRRQSLLKFGSKLIFGGT